METDNLVKKDKRGARVNYAGFEAAYANLPYKHLRNVRRELQKRLQWCPSTFHNKKRGDSPLRENEITIIKEIFERFGIDAWTGEKL
jgi:hypothetical protein